MRLLAAAVLGGATAVAAAVVLGDYPLSGSVPWLSAVLIPVLIGAVMVIVAGGHQTALWVATGPLAAISFAWGVRIATGWGLDPVPASCWAAGAIALVWPPAWGILQSARNGRTGRNGGNDRQPAAAEAGEAGDTPGPVGAAGDRP